MPVYLGLDLELKLNQSEIIMINRKKKEKKEMEQDGEPYNRTVQTTKCMALYSRPKEPELGI